VVIRSRVSSVREQPHLLLAAIGAFLVTTTSIGGSGFNPLSLPFALWSLVPYVLLGVLGRAIRDPWPGIGAGLGALAADVGIRAAVFIWPRGSTAAIALVFSPAYIAAIVMPVGAAAGWLSGRAWRWHPLGRAAVVLLGPAALGLLGLGLARPELFPTTVASRRALVARIGEPRVVTGQNRFESIQVSSTPAWYQTGEFDGQPGDEIAIVDHRGADLLDSTSLAVAQRVEFGGTPGRLWTAFSSLVRMPDGRLMVAQTGGGFSQTLVRDLDGSTRWEYRPDPSRSPDALRPADLDADGRLEFYASTTDALARVDADGQEVWRQPSALASLVGLLPRSGNIPAWIVSVQYGRKVEVRDDSGRLLGERAATADDSPLTAIDSFAGRGLVYGGPSARGYDISGRLLFDVPLGDFRLGHAADARLFDAGTPYVVLVGTTDRETRRYRLLVIGPDRQPVYDEILDHFPRVLVARRADGTDALLVAAERGLRAVRPRA
jgi:hypothetical protein